MFLKVVKDYRTVLKISEEDLKMFRSYTDTVRKGKHVRECGIIDIIACEDLVSLQCVIFFSV